MFTGLIEEVGVIDRIESSSAGARIRVLASGVLENMALGDSIAMDGACMTVVAMDVHAFEVEVSPESLSKTNFYSFQSGRRVNLERPLMPTSRIGGHYVTGHVDGLATLRSRMNEGNSQVLVFEVETPELASLLVSKGSVAILGISLTVNWVNQRQFSVAIIPHTLAHTNLDDYQPGDRVSIETDLLGKYVQRLLSAQFQQSTDADALYSSYPSRVALEPGMMMDAPALGPAMTAINRPEAMPKMAHIHTGNWFNHEPEG